MSDLALFGGPRAVRSPIPAWPQSDNLEIENLADVLRSGHWWRNSGTHAKAFEREFAQYHGCSAGVIVTNGTHALEVALRALGVGRGDEVLVPSMTFIATATAVFAVGATPIPVDVDPRTWCMDADDLERKVNGASRCVIPVHFAGQVCDMDRIQAICKAHGLFLVEDAAHAHGAVWAGKRPGQFGNMAAFSFQNYKLMTAGEGGIVITGDEALAHRAVLIANCGRDPNSIAYDHDLSGSNFRGGEFQGAVLRAQLTRLPALSEQRHRGGALLDRLISGLDGVASQQTDQRTQLHSRYMYVFTVDPQAFGGASRDRIVRALQAEGVPAKPIYPPMECTPYFARAMDAIGAADRYDPQGCPVSRKLGANGIWIHHAALLDERVVREAADAIEKVRTFSGTLNEVRELT